MHHNILGYWQHLENLEDNSPDRPSPRVCRLLLEMFEGWRTRQPFPDFGYFGHVRDRFDQSTNVMAEPLAVRRGQAMAETLRMLVDEQAGRDGFFRVHPDELIVGTMPPFSVGQGKEVMDYLKDGTDAVDDVDEALACETGFLNPWSNFGHVCPDHDAVVQRGLRAIIGDCTAKATIEQDPNKLAFYRAVEIALQGVIDFAEGYALECKRRADIADVALRKGATGSEAAIARQRIACMRDAAARLRRVPAGPCEGFLDAAQCIFLMNCVLHWTGELTSLGRLDQILQPFLEKDGLNDAAAQEIVDCLWVKLGERVVLDNAHVDDHFTSADGALMGAGGASNFDQGALINQWMQQVTIGGVVADDATEQRDACNTVTRLCLKAARRLPFNCPTLDLRVHHDTPADVLELATDAILSGGAHPILMNDDKIVPQLAKAAEGVTLASARNYACDGCYETLFPGKTEFSFYYVFGLDALEKTLNAGAGFGTSGTTHLRGSKSGWRTRQASEIADFEELYRIFEKHVALGAHRGIAELFSAYGAKGKVCPSPILSAMIEGCVASGRDFYDGGARYHIFAPLMTGISTVADSLHIIEKLVFTENSFTLDELVSCLRSDWGAREVTIGGRLAVERIAEIRALCLAQKRFGHGHKEVDEIAWRVIKTFCNVNRNALAHPQHADALASLHERFGSEDHPFIIAITPGVGTFEQYAFGGMSAGATPDGRKAGQPIASDLAASPLPQDLDPLVPETGDAVQAVPFRQALSSWQDDAVNQLSDGAPADINIREDFARDELLEIVSAFAKGEGSNMMTITAANPETFASAEAAPLDYDLLRVRMGGWSEFFSVLYPEHKKQHRRRPLYVDSGGAA